MLGMALLGDAVDRVTVLIEESDEKRPVPREER